MSSSTSSCARVELLEKLDLERSLFKKQQEMKSNEELLKAKLSVSAGGHSFTTESLSPSWKEKESRDIARKIALTAKKPNAAEAWGKLLEKEQKVALKVSFLKVCLIILVSCD